MLIEDLHEKAFKETQIKRNGISLVVSIKVRDCDCILLTKYIKEDKIESMFDLVFDQIKFEIKRYVDANYPKGSS